MYCPYKNSYLQLGTSMDPKVINKMVRCAMRKRQFDPHDEIPAAQRLTSMQPSLFAPCVDITRANVGFERGGLRTINKNITSDDNFIKLQALHSLLDQTQISENALFLINMNVVYRLITLIRDPDPIVREKVTLILTRLCRYYQGRKRIVSRPIIIEHLMFLFMRDRREIRYAAALCMTTLTKHRCTCEIILKNDKIVENLLRMMKNEYAAIVVLHLKSLESLTEWDPVTPLKLNAFQVMLELIQVHEPRVCESAIYCLLQLCKHPVGQKLADIHDLTKVLIPYLKSEDMHVLIAATGLMGYTTVTTQAKWRAKEIVFDLTRRLVNLCLSQSIPVLQMRAMQVLINLCDCPDMKEHIRKSYEKTIRFLRIRNHEEWDGTTTAINFGFETGHNYRTRCIGNVETIKNDFGDNVHSVNVHSYLEQVRSKKAHLLEIMNSTAYIKED